MYFLSPSAAFAPLVTGLRILMPFHWLRRMHLTRLKQTVIKIENIRADSQGLPLIVTPKNNIVRLL